jgi:hypothetical protein
LTIGFLFSILPEHFGFARGAEKLRRNKNLTLGT